MMRTFAGIIALLLAAPGSAAEKPNIVLIVSDDQGYNDLGVLGDHIITPSLDRLAREGVRLTNYYVAWPACTPSRGAFLTGRYPHRSIWDQIIGAVGEHPDGGPVDVGIGRYGPYVKHKSTYASLPKDRFVLDVTLDEALELLRKKTQRGGAALRELGVDDRSGEVVDVREGRFGPYVKRGKLNASLPKDLSPEEVTLEQALGLLDARAQAVAAKGGTGAKRGRAAGTKKATTKKKATATRSTTKRSSAKKAASGAGAKSRTRTVKGKTTRSGARKTKTP